MDERTPFFPNPLRCRKNTNRIAPSNFYITRSYLQHVLSFHMSPIFFQYPSPFEEYGFLCESSEAPSTRKKIKTLLYKSWFWQVLWRVMKWFVFFKKIIRNQFNEKLSESFHWSNTQQLEPVGGWNSKGVMMLSTQTLHYYVGNPSKPSVHFYCLIPPKWVPFNDPCSKLKLPLSHWNYLGAQPNHLISRFDIAEWYRQKMVDTWTSHAKTLKPQEMTDINRSIWGIHILIYIMRIHIYISYMANPIFRKLTQQPPNFKGHQGTPWSVKKQQHPVASAFLREPE